MIIHRDNQHHESTEPQTNSGAHRTGQRQESVSGMTKAPHPTLYPKASAQAPAMVRYGFALSDPVRFS